MSVPKWIIYSGALTGVCTTYVVYDTYRSRRYAVPLMRADHIVRTEECMRYPCQQLKGFDAVVKNYYVAEGRAAPLEQQRQREQQEHGSQSWLSSFTSLFSDEKHRVDSKQRVSGGQEDTRLFVANGGSCDGGGGEKPPALVAASTWPVGTQKYSALVLEPSATGGRAARDGEDGGGALRWLADHATEQSLVRCQGRSAAVDMNCTADPSFLGAPYLRVMLSAFLLLPQTLSMWRVAVLGVGGGSLPNFLQSYFSRRLQQLDLVDIEPTCFRAAVEQMGMTEPMNERVDGSLRMYAVDAETYLNGITRATPEAQEVLRRQHPKQPSHLDVLFVDLFVGSELHTSTSTPAFLQQCKDVLSPQGVVVFNLPQRNAPFVKRCEGIFGAHNVFPIPVPASSNTVVVARRAQGVELGLGGRAPSVSHRQLFYRAKDFQNTYQLPYDLANHFPVWWRFW